MSNQLLEKVIADRKGNYCHALEVNDMWELQSVVESVIEAYPGFSESTYIEFFQSMEIYCLDESNEDEVYSFDFSEYITDTI